MTWTIQYYEAHDGTQPAEVFEDELERTHAKLLGKLKRVGEATSKSDLTKASRCWQDYLKTRKVSPEEPDNTDEEVKP